jgi:hypothetical protein
MDATILSVLFVYHQYLPSGLSKKTIPPDLKNEIIMYFYGFVKWDQANKTIGIAGEIIRS